MGIDRAIGDPNRLGSPSGNTYNKSPNETDYKQYEAAAKSCHKIFPHILFSKRKQRLGILVQDLFLRLIRQLLMTAQIV